tara:strand:- start:69 stop:1748 length:1680 start_codon:yes stop_codon:yes gene_type:complete
MRLILFILLFLQCRYIIGQESRFSIEGNGRGINQSVHLNEKDSLNNDIDFESNVVVDLGIRANLNEKVNFYSQIRMRSNLALFDTSRSNIFIRQFRLYGNFNDLFYYELGDVDLALDRYTLWNNKEKGLVNESEVFSLYRRIQYYENFQNENFWRQKGVKLSFNELTEKQLKIYVELFGSRLNKSNEFTNPDIFLVGLKSSLSKDNQKFEFNSANIFSNTNTLINSNLSNQYNRSVTASYSKLFGKFSGTLIGGYSENYDLDNNFDISGELFEFIGRYNLAGNNFISVSYRSVADDFISLGSQNSNINYGNSPSYFQQVTNSSIPRNLSFYDILTDFNNSNIFNLQLNSDRLIEGARLGTSVPFGKATPNRKGFNLIFNYSDKNQNIDYLLDLSLLNDVTGEGVVDNKQYFDIDNSLSLNINKFYAGKKELETTFGMRYSSSNRASSNPYLDEVSLSSTLIDLGLVYNLIKNIDLLYGYKNLYTKGTDYLPIYNNYYAIENYDKANFNYSESIQALGLKYNVNKGFYLIFSANQVNVDDKIINLKYDFNQYLLILNINF